MNYLIIILLGIDDLMHLIRSPHLFHGILQSRDVLDFLATDSTCAQGVNCFQILLYRGIKLRQIVYLELSVCSKTCFVSICQTST